MSDFLLQLSKNPSARWVVQTLGLPIPLPQALERAEGPWEERPLSGRQVVVGAAPGGGLAEPVAQTLAAAGAEAVLGGGAAERAVFDAAGEAYGRPVRVLGELPDGALTARALVFDATGVDGPGGLRALYDFFHPLTPQLARSGRVVVLGRPLEACPTAAAAAAQMAIEGFVRSVAKEVGRRGATANLVRVAPGAEGRLEGVLRFLLSPRAAFISGQPLTVTGQARALERATPWVRPLDTRVVLVTGAARGIGAATVRLLAREGARVLCLDRPADEAETRRVAEEIGGTALPCDITDPDAPERIAREVQERFGGLDVIVHNAGITRDRTLARMKPEQWDQALEVNLGAVLRLTDALLAGPLRDGGRIVCLSSIAGLAGNMGQTNYAASKAGIVGLVRQLAPRVADRGITVNAIAPGFIETRMTAAVPLMIREAGRRLSSLGQGGLPQDIGELVTFLSSPGAQGLTGQVLRACGGALIGA